jgi:hypothetical protein
MDVGPAEWAGRPLAWESGAGAVHPAHYDPVGLGWLRSFPGGLMVGCGLDNVGVPSSDEGEDLGLHGRLSHTPAELLACGGAWRGDEYEMWVEGQVRHFELFGANLLLRRRISAWLGGNSLSIEDTITNQGFETTPFQLLYHCNYGFPIISPDTELWVETEKSEPRDEEAARGFDRHTQFEAPTPGYAEQVFFHHGFDRHTQFEAPTPGYAEQVFFHHPLSDDKGYARAALINRAMNLGAYIRFRKAELPHLIEWKMMGQGAYVVGLEPANCSVSGRSYDREHGVLQFLESGQSVSTALEIGVLPDAASIETYVHNQI